MAAPRTLVALFTVAIFTGAFLMFQLELMVARLVLPILGGAPSVWNGCVLFFQICLMAGYAIAHAGTRLTPRAQATTYVLLILGALWWLPIAIQPSSAVATASPTSWLLATLALSIGIPFLALTICGPALQGWFSAGGHESSKDPYFLYAASNAGSLLALLLYPVVIEPLLPLGAQRRLWTGGFLAFAALVATCGWLVSRRSRASSADSPDTREDTGGAVTWGRRWKWAALSAISSSLLLGVTSYLTTDIAAVPLLWVIPLAIYLATFVAAFGGAARWSATASRKLPLFLAALATVLGARVGGPVWLVTPLHLVTFAMAVQACHGRLADDRPATTHLTEYYLWLACGGMFGSLFNTFAAPALFDSVIEYPVALVAAAAMAANGVRRLPTLRSLIAPLLVGAATLGLTFVLREIEADQRLLLAALGVPAVLAFSLAREPLRFAPAIGGMLLAAALAWNPYGQLLHSERTFFGVYRVTQDVDRNLRFLFHGTTLHGVQAIHGTTRYDPLTYYSREGPFGQALRSLPGPGTPRNVAVVGLGVGSLAAYAAPGQTWTFFEIDPAVERIARTPEYFTHLEECGARCTVVIGDARVSLGHVQEHTYDLLVLDAFSSDAIPVHLLTREALDVYVTHLTHDGVLAFHVSNRHLNLSPLLSSLAADAGLTAVEQRHTVSPEESASGRSSSHWVFMGRNGTRIAHLTGTAWHKLTDRQTRIWTDDFSNILGLLDIH